MSVVDTMISLSKAYGETVLPVEGKIELTEDELIALGCRFVPFHFSNPDKIPPELFQKNVIILMEAYPVELMRGATEPIKGADEYEEDGTAGAYETSGNCARAFFDPNFSGEVSPFIVVDGETHFPLDALDIYTGGYTTCSCYMPEEVATFDDYEETQEVIDAFLRNKGYDPVKSYMSDSPVKEEKVAGRLHSPSRDATDTAIENAVLEFARDVTGLVLVVPPELIPTEDKGDSSHLAERMAEFDAFGDGESTNPEEPVPETKD